jgi:hypothetical protein
MSHICLTNLQKCNRARWQMLFHPTVLTLEFYNPLTFGQMCIFCASWAFTGWNVTQKTLLFDHDSSVTPSPSQHDSSWLVQRTLPPPLPIAARIHVLSFTCCDIIRLIFLRIPAPHITTDSVFSPSSMSCWISTHTSYLYFMSKYCSLTYLQQKFCIAALL